MMAVACVGACSSHRGGSNVATSGSYKVGSPYTIDGTTYVPREEFNHVETGVASWYGPGFHGKSTANGERYDQRDRTAAHRTLQMPAIVRVTNLENGQSTVVRINDRGPYARNRIIDLSRAAAEELDIVRHGTARVRIDQLPAESQAVKDVAMGGGSPSEQMTAVAQVAAGRRGAPAANPPPAAVTASARPGEPPPAYPAAAEPVSAPPALAPPALAPPALATPPVRGGGYYVQTGAFSTIGNAERQRDVMSGYGTPEIQQASTGGRDIYRVRLGPYTTSDAAGIVAHRLKRSGYGDARVVAD